MKVQEKEALAQRNEALSRQVQQLSSQLAQSDRSGAHELPAALPESPLESAVVHAAQSAARLESNKPTKITSASIIGTSDKVQASLQQLQTQLQATCECLGVASSCDAAMEETRTLCKLLRRRLMKTVGAHAIEMDTALRRVLAWSDESQVGHSACTLSLRAQTCVMK